jgi:hypothetical protein
MKPRIRGTISKTEAARRLGYKQARSINDLIETGVLKQIRKGPKGGHKLITLQSIEDYETGGVR